MTEPLRWTWRSFHVPKAGNAPDEYEDASAGDPERGRFAIADGASESAFAGAWAQQLVTAYVETPGPWSRWLPAARRRWDAAVHERELPWYAEAKAEEGAYAALLGVAFKGDRWRATAVGDCCLFQLRAGRLLRAFPLHRADDFANRPSLIGSRSRRPTEPRARRIRTRGRMQPDDVLLLMSDALAQWLLTRVEQGSELWPELQGIARDEQFRERITQLRESGALRNDDVTFGMIALPAGTREPGQA